MTLLRGHGLAAQVPAGWDGLLRVRPAADGDPGVGVTSAAVAAGAGSAAALEQQLPVLNLANFALPADLGDYGGGATEAMAPHHILVNLAEFGPDSVGAALFAAEGFPVLQTGDFDPAAMPRPLAGQSGSQRFFTVAGRAFCLHVVLGSHRRRIRTLPLVRDVVAGIKVQ